jgi:large subunit ribosomal protein L1
MKKKQTNNDPITEEKIAEEESESMASRQDEATQDATNLDEEAEQGLIAEEAADADQQEPAELAAIHTDNESAKAVNKKSTRQSKKEEVKIAKSSRSANYKKAEEHIERGKFYSLDDAIEVVKKASYSKFDGSFELHLKLTKKKSKGNTESSRGVFHLPHGTGKTKKVIVLDEGKIEEIFKTKKIDFDVAIATPDLMPKVGKIAKILGPKGKMPDPKSGTVTTDPKKAIEEINSGKADYRIDAANNIHQIVGKTSWDAAKIKENIQAALGGFPKSKIEIAYLTATMSPSVQLDLSFLK